MCDPTGVVDFEPAGYAQSGGADLTAKATIKQPGIYKLRLGTFSTASEGEDTSDSAGRSAVRSGEAAGVASLV
jgi:hypothetical protein